MQNITKKLFSSMAAVFAIGFAGPAFAQSASAAGSLTVIRPLTVTKTADMTFGTVIRPATGGTAGTVIRVCSYWPTRGAIPKFNIFVGAREAFDNVECE